MMSQDGDRPTPVPNGNALPFDLTNPDLPGLAGYVASMSADLNEVKQEQQRQGRVLDKVAQALGIEPDKSDPPPPFRAQLDSHQKELKRLQEQQAAEQAELQRLQKVDAETSQNIAAVTKEVAETKVIVRVGLIEGIPKLAKVGAGLTAALLALAALGAQIWAAIHGR